MNRRPACFQEGFKTRKTPLKQPLERGFLVMGAARGEELPEGFQSVAVERYGGARSRKSLRKKSRPGREAGPHTRRGMNDASSIATALWQTREGGEAFALAGLSIEGRFQEPMMGICMSHVLNDKKM